MKSFLQEAILGTSWPYLGPSWPVLGSSWPILEPCWAILGLSWGHLGQSWGCPGGSKIVFSLGTSSQKGEMAISARCYYGVSSSRGQIETSWGHLGRSWGHLGAISGLVGAILGHFGQSRSCRGSLEMVFSLGMSSPNGKMTMSN